MLKLDPMNAMQSIFQLFSLTRAEGEESQVVITVCMIFTNKYHPVRFTTTLGATTRLGFGLDFICQNYNKT